MITDQQEANLAAAHARAKKKQDKTNPYVVNITDGRLMPNTPRLRAHKDYRVYPVSQEEARKSTVVDRLKWIERSAAMPSGPKVVNSMSEADTFDVGSANADEMAVFAMENFGLALDPKKPLKALRKEVMEAAEADEKRRAATEDLT